MDHDLELIIPDPGNVWKFVFNNFLISWKYWKSKSSTFSIILEILDIEVFNILYNPGNTGGGQAAPGARLQGLGLFLEYVPAKTNMVTLELRSKQALF